MKAVTISSKYRVVIPKNVRERLRLQPSQKVQVIPFEDRIEMIPEQQISDMRGFLRGMDTGIVRE